MSVKVHEAGREICGKCVLCKKDKMFFRDHGLLFQKTLRVVGFAYVCLICLRISIKVLLTLVS